MSYDALAFSSCNAICEIGLKTHSSIRLVNLHMSTIKARINNIIDKCTFTTPNAAPANTFEADTDEEIDDLMFHREDRDPNAGHDKKNETLLFRQNTLDDFLFYRGNRATEAEQA
ncbi:hypothetical protein AC1031_017707 [Aphanomyces cochlioides]|nr:hypothetical protein AC1031_017707 [Aphanomyces cochlioides]